MTIYVDFEGRHISSEDTIFDDIAELDEFQEYVEENWKDGLSGDELDDYPDVEKLDDMPEDIRDRIYDEMFDIYFWKNYETFEF